MNKIINKEIGIDLIKNYKRSFNILNTEMNKIDNENFSNVDPALFKSNYEKDLYKTSVIFERSSWVNNEPSEGDHLEARIRYHSDIMSGVLTSTGQRSRFDFDLPARGPTPGQLLVFYRGTEVVGGGIIADALVQ